MPLKALYLVLFVLIFNIPVNSFSVMAGESLRQYSMEFMYLAQRHNTVLSVGIKPQEN